MVKFLQLFLKVQQILMCKAESRSFHLNHVHKTKTFSLKNEYNNVNACHLLNFSELHYLLNCSTFLQVSHLLYLRLRRQKLKHY